MAQEDGPPIGVLPSFRPLPGRSSLRPSSDEALDPAGQPFDPRFFHLDRDPFSARPDPSFLYTNAELRAHYASLLDSIRTRYGLFLLTGAQGVGKTALLERLAWELRASGYLFISHYRAGLSFEDLASILSEELGVPGLAGDEQSWLARVREAIGERAQAQRDVVLLIDDAQNLGRDVILKLDPLMRTPDGDLGALRLVLAGRPDTRRRLDSPVLERLADALALHREIEPLSDDDIGSLVWHRLRRAGHRRIDLFTDGGIAAIAHHARGIPGRAVLLCAGALRLACAEGRSVVTEELVERAASGLHPDHGPAWHAPGALASPDGRRSPFRAAHFHIAGAVLAGLGVCSTAAVALVARMPDAADWGLIGQAISSARFAPPSPERPRAQVSREADRDVSPPPRPESDAAPMLLVQSEQGAEAEPAVFRPPATLPAPLDLPAVPEDENSASGAEATEPAPPPADMAEPPASVDATPAADRSAAPDDAPAATGMDAAATPGTPAALDDAPDSLPDAAETEAAAVEAPGDQAVDDEAAAVESPGGLGGDAPPAGVPLAAPSDGSNAPSVASEAPADGPLPAAASPQPPSPAVARGDETDDLIRLLVARGERQIAAGRIALPPHDNATETYRQILAIAPGGAAGPVLLERIRSGYREQARAAQRDGNTAEAALLDELALKPVVDDDEPDRGAARAAPEAGAPDTGAPDTGASLAASAGTAIPPPRAVPGPTSGKAAVSKQMIDTLMKRGQEMLAIGDISAARLLYERAAMAGEAKAATAAGKTYDPNFLREISAHGVPPRPDRAAEWYRRAADAGDAEASARLTKLRDAAGR